MPHDEARFFEPMSNFMTALALAAIGSDPINLFVATADRYGNHFKLLLIDVSQRANQIA